MWIRGLLVAIYDTNPYVKGSCQVTKSSEVYGSGNGSEGVDRELKCIGNVDLCKQVAGFNSKSSLDLAILTAGNDLGV